MKAGGVLVLLAMVGCASSPEKGAFVRDERHYEHFILGSNAPSKAEQEQIDFVVVSKVEADTMKLERADQEVVSEIVEGIKHGRAVELAALKYGRQIVDPTAADFWTAVLETAALNESFPNCAEREMQLAQNVMISRSPIEAGQEVRTSCDSYVDEKIEEDPSLWRVRNRMLWTCEGGREDRAFDHARLMARAQSFLKGKGIGQAECLNTENK